MNPSHSRTLRRRMDNRANVLRRTFQLLICLALTVPTSAKLSAQYHGSFTDIRPVAGLGTPPGSQFGGDLSNDGLSLLFTLGPSPGTLLHEATRESIADPFNEPVKIDSLNRVQADNFGQTVSSDGRTTYYASGPAVEGGGPSGIWTAVRESREDDWSVPQKTEIGDGTTTQWPILSNDDLTMYFNADHGGKPGIFKVERTRADEPFGDPEQISELSSNRPRFGPAVSSDELAIMFSTAGPSGVSTMIATRFSKDEPFGEAIDLDDFGLGSELNSASSWLGFPVLSPNWPEDGSKLYFTRNLHHWRLYEATWSVSALGDFNADDVLDIEDLNQLQAEIKERRSPTAYDLDNSGTIDLADRQYWVTNVKSTWIGDANLDGQFNSSDIVSVLQAGKFNTIDRAGWNEGDWDGNEFFDREDIVAALQDGGYGQGLRSAQQSSSGVPQEGSFAAIASGGGIGDGQTSLVYDASSGELSLDAPAGVELTSINVDSAAGIFTGAAAQNLGGRFDNDADANIFKATFGGSFGSVSFGNVAQAGLSEEFVLSDLSVVGSLAGGGDLGNVDLVYVPEPAAIGLLAFGLLVVLPRYRRTRI